MSDPQIKANVSLKDSVEAASVCGSITPKTKRPAFAGRFRNPAELASPLNNQRKAVKPCPGRWYMQQA